MSDEDEYLLHYGVMGMKWGVRKSRGPVSSLKKKIKAHKKASVAKKREKARVKKNILRTTKSPSKMTDAELKSSIQRLELEKRYRDLSTEGRARSKGKQVAKDILWSTGSRLAKDALYQIGAQGVNKMAGYDLISTNKKKDKKKDQS